MGRKINDKLLKELKGGKLERLLKCIKNDNELLFEVRTDGKAIIYYQKCKILEIRPRSFYFDPKYLNYSGCTIESIDPREAASAPEEYFAKAKGVVDGWLGAHNKNEFEIQQRIARDNRSARNRYVIFDMEYQFAQSGIPADERIKTGCYDLVGIDTQENKIVFFEVKRGLKALTGSSGIKEHIVDFRRVLFGEGVNRDKKSISATITKIFRQQLSEDIANIIKDKTELDLWDTNYRPDTTAINLDDTELIFVYCYDKKHNPDEKKRYKKVFTQETEGLTIKSQPIFVDPTAKKIILK